MTYVVTEKCIGCKHSFCVQVCPVDCFYEGENFIVIDPDECVDCGLCEIECPVDAIFSESDMPQDQLHFMAMNKELSKLWPKITEKKSALPDADEWEKIENKLVHLIR